MNLPERHVLPRVSDVVERLTALKCSCQHSEDIKRMVLDFKDAFKQLEVSPMERRYVAGDVELWIGTLNSAFTMIATHAHFKWR